MVALESWNWRFLVPAGHIVGVVCRVVPMSSVDSVLSSVSVEIEEFLSVSRMLAGTMMLDER